MDALSSKVVENGKSSAFALVNVYANSEDVGVLVCVVEVIQSGVEEQGIVAISYDLVTVESSVGKLVANLFANKVVFPDRVDEVIEDDEENEVSEEEVVETLVYAFSLV